MDWKALHTMHNFPEQRKGPAVNFASAFCSAAEFLSEAKIRGIKAGTVLLVAALIAALVASIHFDTLLFVYLFIFGTIPAQIAQFLICKRKGLGDYLLETGLRYAGLGVGWWIARAFFNDDSFLSIFSLMIGPFVGDGVHALFRKWYRKT